MNMDSASIGIPYCLNRMVRQSIPAPGIPGVPMERMMMVMISDRRSAGVIVIPKAFAKKKRCQ